MLKHLTKGRRKLFWILAALALVGDLATKEWLYRPATARPRQITEAAATPGAVRALDLADLDGDGDSDLIIARESAVVYHENMGAGQFGETQPLLADLSSLRDVQALDVDADGDTDLVVAGDGITWYENRGGLSFAVEGVIASGTGSARICAADFDGDGDEDILVASETMAWYENTPEDRFATRHDSPGSTDPGQSVKATDMDGDGDADVLVLHGGTIRWYVNQAGELVQGASLETGGEHASFHVADLDGDGDPDLLLGALTISWYENLGGGKFRPAGAISHLEKAAQHLATADLDLDGDVDVVAVSAGRLIWVENDPRDPIVVIPGLLDIVPHEGNTQGAFGLGPSSPAFFAIAAVIGLGIILVLLWRVPADRWHMHVALGLLAGGAVGNLYDRLARGSVRDFIDLHWQDWHWPTFNIADVAICAGFIIIVLDSFLATPAQESPGSGEETPAEEKAGGEA